jgi:hypothetical protein
MTNPFPLDTPNWYYYQLMETRDRMKAGELLITDVKMSEVAFSEAVKRYKGVTQCTR